jgi:DNA invertase Pin-like site-specific DNA recombinase
LHSGCAIAGVTQLEIKESVEEMEGLVRQHKHDRIKQRVQALYLIKAENTKVKAIAKILGKHRSTVHRWLADSKNGGIEAVVWFGTSPAG